MISALAISGERLVIAQAAAGAILTVAAPIGEAGPQRLVDALIGAGVALVISQLLFPAEPVALLRRAEAAAVDGLGADLRLTAAALAHDDPALAERARRSLRLASGRLVDLASARERSTRVVRWSPVWWRREGPVVREEENAARRNCHRGDSGSDSATSARSAAGIAPIQNIARQFPEPASARLTRYDASSPITIRSWLSVSIRPRMCEGAISPR
jgi:hypothetical protein